MSQDKGADGTCETVIIKVAPSEGNPDGLVRINKSDFDESVHELFEPKKSKEDDGKGGKSKKDDGGKSKEDDGKGGKSKKDDGGKSKEDDGKGGK